MDHCQVVRILISLRPDNDFNPSTRFIQNGAFYSDCDMNWSHKVTTLPYKLCTSSMATLYNSKFSSQKVEINASAEQNNDIETRKITAHQTTTSREKGTTTRRPHSAIKPKVVQGIDERREMFPGPSARLVVPKRRSIQICGWRSISNLETCFVRSLFAQHLRPFCREQNNVDKHNLTNTQRHTLFVSLQSGRYAPALKRPLRVSLYMSRSLLQSCYVHTALCGDSITASYLTSIWIDRRTAPRMPGSPNIAMWKGHQVTNGKSPKPPKKSRESEV